MNENQILWYNANYLQIDLENYYLDSAQRVVEYLEENLSKNISIGIVCGLGGNGADGLAIGLKLITKKFTNINIYIVGREKNSKSAILKSLFCKLKEKSLESDVNVKIMQDIYHVDISFHELFLEALSGEGFEGNELTKRPKDILNKIKKFGSKIYSIDKPVKGHKPDLQISIGYMRNNGMEEINFFSHIPTSLSLFCGPGERMALKSPNHTSHKNKNGKFAILTSNLKEDLQSKIDDLAKEYATNYDVFDVHQLPDDLADKVYGYDAFCFLDLGDSFLEKAIFTYLYPFLTHQNIVVSNCFCFDDDFIFSSKTCLVYHSSNLAKKSILLHLKRYSTLRKVYAVLCSTQIQLIGLENDFRVVPSPMPYNTDITQIIALAIACYSTRNDLWLSIRAVF